jgi:hypothetical protein
LSPPRSSLIEPGSETIEAVADRGYDSGEEILACEQAGITVFLPKPMTSGINAKGRFGKQDFVYVTVRDRSLPPWFKFANSCRSFSLLETWTPA